MAESLLMLDPEYTTFPPMAPISAAAPGIDLNRHASM